MIFSLLRQSRPRVQRLTTRTCSPAAADQLIINLITDQHRFDECWSSSDHQHQQFLINTDYTLNNFLSLWVGSNQSHLWTGWQINIKHATKLFDFQNSLSCIKWVSITGKKPTKLYYWNQSSLIFTSGELNSRQQMLKKLCLVWFEEG